jgi:hypothetical protein
MDRQPDINVEQIPLCALLDEIKRRGIVKLTIDKNGTSLFEYRVEYSGRETSKGFVRDAKL